MNISPTALEQWHFVQTSKFFSFYLELYKNSSFLLGPVNSNFHFEDCYVLMNNDSNLSATVLIVKLKYMSSATSFGDWWLVL